MITSARNKYNKNYTKNYKNNIFNFYGKHIYNKYNYLPELPNPLVPLFVSSNSSTLPSNLGSKNWKVYEVSVSKNELRKFLEEQKIINSLNTGF